MGRPLGWNRNHVSPRSRGSILNEGAFFVAAVYDGMFLRQQLAKLNCKRIVPYHFSFDYFFTVHAPPNEASINPCYRASKNLENECRPAKRSHEPPRNYATGERSTGSLRVGTLYLDDRTDYCAFSADAAAGARLISQIYTFSNVR